MKRYEFGTAPQAKRDGYTKLQAVEISDEQHLVEEYAGRDVAIVDGATTRDGKGEFAIYVRATESQAVAQ